ncbi:MAG: hypothetical protein CSA84_00185 [Actinomycetales bacterium]|nr:MAG: hypothetical protein CSA84_00185 [Actinomycetales bacterium]
MTRPSTSAPWPGHSALVVPVPELERLVRARHEHYDPAYRSTDPRFAHAHITVLAPFIGPDDLLKADPVITHIASQTMAFDYELTRVATFPNGIIHVVPEPAGRFRELTAALSRAFPRFVPYAGIFGPGPESIVPHLTVDAVGPDVDELVVRRWVQPLMPVRARAERLQLSWYEPNACRTLRSWLLSRG